VELIDGVISPHVRDHHIGNQRDDPQHDISDIDHFHEALTVAVNIPPLSPEGTSTVFLSLLLSDFEEHFPGNLPTSRC
jgi:hypothetical protein